MCTTRSMAFPASSHCDQIYLLWVKFDFLFQIDQSEHQLCSYLMVNISLNQSLIYCATLDILFILLSNSAEDQSRSCHSSPQMVLPGSVFNPHLLIPVVKTPLFFMKKHVWLRTNNSRKSVPTARAVTQKAGWWPPLEGSWTGAEFPRTRSY